MTRSIWLLSLDMMWRRRTEKINMARWNVGILMLLMTSWMAVFSLAIVWGVFFCTFFFNVAPQKMSHMFQIQKICWRSKFNPSGLWVSQNQNAVPKVLLQIVKHLLGPMDLSSVLNEPHPAEISVTLINGDENMKTLKHKSLCCIN